MKSVQILMMALALCCSGLSTVVLANEEMSVDFEVSVDEEQFYGSCNPQTQPYPHWGMKGNQCLKSCGYLGGTHSFSDSCERHGMRDVGNAYDVPYCCAGSYGGGGPGRQCTDRYGRRVPCDQDRGPQCTDPYGRRIPCEQDRRPQCTDRYGRRVPCDHDRVPDRRQCTDRYGRQVPCSPGR
ncbi:MAG: hypothetical protein AB7F59_10700 [Bdellovibrionales bacterium]